MAEFSRRSAADRDLRLQRLDHFTVPVRDFNVGRKFYSEVLGGVVTKEPDWEPYRRGRTIGAHMAIQLFNGEGHLVLYWQPWGQPAPDQMFPHRALAVSSADMVDEIRSRLERASVPYVAVADRQAPKGEKVAVSLYFRDPDMNQLEVRCTAYPFGAGLHVGPFDPTVQSYRWADWRALVPDGGAPEPGAGDRRGS